MSTTALSVGDTPAPDSEVLRHLLLSFPELEIAHDGRDVVDALVQGAICHVLSRGGIGRMVILTDVAQALRDDAGLTYEPAELVAAFERLERRGCLSFRDSTKRSFVFNETAYHSIRAAFERRMSAWETIQTAWMDEVRTRHGLEQADVATLWEGLDAFISRLVNTHAAEAACFLYMTRPDGHARFERILDAGVPGIADLVPEPLLEVARAEFLRFFDLSSPGRTDYLTSRLRAAFFFHLLSVDSSASELVREHVAEKVLYLDSNFLFRLLGFHGPFYAYAPATIVEVSRRLGCRLVVAQETVDEFVRVVKANVGQLRGTPIHREAYLRIATAHPTDEGDFMRAFYQELQNGQVRTLDEYARKWTNVRSFLKHYGIEIDEDAVLTEDEQRGESFVDQVSRLNQWHNGGKGIAAVDHDVFMLRYVRRLRGPVDAGRGDVRYWFLTFDRQLTRFATRQSSDEQYPSVMLAEDWLQVARPFLPRTDDYAKSFVAMLRNPMLLEGSSAVPFAHMAEALSRLERYQELPEAVVGAMVADEEFVRRFREAEREEEAKAVVELKAGQIAAGAITESEGLREQLERMAQQMAGVQQQVDTLRDARDAADRERAAARAEAAGTRQAAETDVARAERLAAEQVAAAARRHSEEVERLRRDEAQRAEQAVERARAEEREAARTRQRWTAYVCLCGAFTITSALLLTVRWDDLSVVQRVIIAGWVPILWAVLLVIPKSANVALGVTASVAGLLAWAATTYQFWVQPPVPAAPAAPAPAVAPATAPSANPTELRADSVRSSGIDSAARPTVRD